MNAQEFVPDVTERTGMLLANLRRPQNLSEKEEVFDVLPYSLVCRFKVKQPWWLEMQNRELNPDYE